jgi:hypothetical protein
MVAGMMSLIISLQNQNLQNILIFISLLYLLIISESLIAVKEILEVCICLNGRSEMQCSGWSEVKCLIKQAM